MIPRWHIILGLAFALLIWFFVPNISPIFILLIFLSSFLIDFDHYANSVLKTRKWKLKHAFAYHKKKRAEELEDLRKGIRKKGDFHIFHTVEFHALIGILGLFFQPFFYIFLGMFFHSLLDITKLTSEGLFHRREFFFFNWFGKKIKQN